MTVDLSLLNPKQRDAALLIDGPVLVLAGPGSGKTRTLTHRIAHIIESGRASAHGILAVTFTKQAALELRERLARLVGETAKDITAGTIHSFAYKILSAEADAVGFKKESLKILSADDSDRLLSKALEDLKLEEGRFNPKEIRTQIDRWKDELCLPEDVQRQSKGFYEVNVAKIYGRYQQLLREANSMDYGDLICYAIMSLRRNPKALEFWQNMFQYVSVDEFQDTSYGQYQLILHLVWRHRNLCAVGSPVQAIYSWRGADIANILTKFKRHFPDAPRVVLDENYRSTANILNASQAVVRKLPYREDLTTPNPPGDPITVVTTHTDLEEADYIVREIQHLGTLGFEPHHCVVLFRSRSQISRFEQVLVKRSLPYTIIGEYKFFSRKEIRDLLSYMRLAVDPTDSAALQRIVNRPSRRLGTSVVDTIRKGEPLTADCFTDIESRKDLSAPVKQAAIGFRKLVFETLPAGVTRYPLPEFIDFVIRETNYETFVQLDSAEGQKRWQNLRLLRSISQGYVDRENPLDTFLAEVALLDDGDIYGNDDRGVTLATVHAVKGLEFPAVFIAGLGEGTFPSSVALQSPGGLEEEHRLMFVAMTRAMNKLYLTWSQTRVVKEKAIDFRASRFLSMVPKELIEFKRTNQHATVMPYVSREQPAEPEPALVDAEASIPIDLNSPLPPLENRSWDVISRQAVTPSAEATLSDLAAPAPAEFEFEPPDEYATELGRHEIEDVSVEFEASILDDLAPYEESLLVPEEPEFQVSDQLDAWLAEEQNECLEYIMEEAAMSYDRAPTEPVETANVAASRQTDTAPPPALAPARVPTPDPAASTAEFAEEEEDEPAETGEFADGEDEPAEVVEFDDEAAVDTADAWTENDDQDEDRDD
jgi:DNA helicase II / ATP-dependent DNA helicase PcrA